MDAQAIAKALENKKAGQFFTIKMRRPAKTFKGCTENIEKETVMQGILCDYANRGPVKAAVASGERDEPETPSWVTRTFKIGAVKFWESAKGEIYLCVPTTGNTPKVQWYLNDQPVDKTDVAQYLLASENPKPVDKETLAEKGQASFNAIKVDNILEVH
jgi:hypothetical protein